MKVAYVFATSGHTASYKLGKMILPQLEQGTHGVEVVGLFFFDDNNYILRKGDPIGERLAKVAKEHGYTFPYVWDETQEIAKAYGAVCTPDFFGFNRQLELQYRGRLDASRKEATPADARRDLFEGMLQVAETGQGPRVQIPSIGCSIKWRTE